MEIKYVKSAARLLDKVCMAPSFNPKILGVLNGYIPPICRNIGGAIAPPAPQVPLSLLLDNVCNNLDPSALNNQLSKSFKQLSPNPVAQGAAGL